MTIGKNLSRRSNRRRLTCQALETRKMMAGDVSVDPVYSGAVFDLSIVGDSENNSIEVVQNGSQLEIRGLDNTLINGSENPHVIALNRLDLRTLDDIMIEMGHGSDSVVMSDVQVGGQGLPAFGARGHNLSVNMGTGNNRFEATDIFVRDHFTLDSTVRWAGNNRVSLRDIDVGQDLRFYSSGGNDMLQINDSTIGDDFYVSTAQGSDDIALIDSSVGDNINIDTGSGDDFMNLTNVDADDIYLVGNRGNDQFFLRDVNASDDIHVHGGSGNDTFWGIDVTCPDLRMYGGRGSDFFTVINTTTDWFRLDGGYGSDTVEMTDVNTRSGRFTGGYGTDVISITFEDEPLTEQRMEATAARNSFESVS